MKQKLILLTVLLAALSAFSTEYYVDASRLDDTGSATNWATAKQTIQAAVDLTAAGDTVWVTNGVYDAGGAVTPGYLAANRVCITNSITVRSINGPDETIIKGSAGTNGENDSDSVRGVFMANSCSLIGFTITNGYSMGSGDYDFDRSGGSLWLTVDCLVSNCILSGQSERCGGGAFFQSGGTLNNCTLCGSSANISGGGAYCKNGGTLNNCILSKNMAKSYEGGGVAFVGTGGVLNNCFLIGNSSKQSGGGVILREGNTMNNCTLSGNSAGWYGGGAEVYFGGRLNNCIVQGNTAKFNSGNDIYRYSSSIDAIQYTCASDGVTHGLNGCITNNPRFADGVNSNCHLKASSPCINAGHNDYVSTDNDLDNNPRVTDGVVDMGAFETQLLTIYTITTTAGEDGSITPANPPVYSGYDETFFIQAQTGYHIGSLMIDGTAIPVVSNYTFTNVQTAHTIDATFGANSYLLTVENGFGNGSYTIETVVSVSADTPEEGYGFSYWSVDPSEYTNGLSDAFATSTTFTMPANDVKLRANYKILPVIFCVDASRSDDSGDGRSWATAKKSIQAAVDLASDNDTVLVTNGIYDTGGAVTSGYSLTNRVYIAKPIIVRSVNGPNVTVIRGAAGSNGSNDVNAVRGVYMDNGSTLIGFTVTNGHTKAFGYVDVECAGGGICMRPNCIVSNCILSKNTASVAGGGVYLLNGGTLNNCTLNQNWANEGGGAYLYDMYSRGILDNCTLSKNSATKGGGVYLNNGGTLNNCIVWGNTTSESSGENIFKESYGMTIRYTCSPDGVTNGIDGCITSTPIFVNNANDFRLQSNSPCINTGNNDYAPEGTDLAGNPRVIGRSVDMGAYEFYATQDDYDSDGIPNGWAAEHFGGINRADANAVCSNGVNTIRQAYIAGLDPNDPDSKLLTSFLRSPTSGNELQWQGVSGRVYAVYYSTNLISGFQPLETNIPWSAGCFTDSVHHAHGQLFYKLDVRFDNSAESGGGGVEPDNPFNPGGGSGGGDTPATPI